MDISARIAEIKKEPGFGEKVGMVLVHNGTVRGFSRKDGTEVTRLTTKVDFDRIEAIRAEFEAREGIFRVVAEAIEGEMEVGDDLLYLIVAGDFRENVLSTMTDLLNTIKAEAVQKSEA